MKRMVSYDVISNFAWFCRGICETNKNIYNLIDHLIKPMARAYTQLFQDAAKIREFFGLRDFYWYT